jgi:hypothetical protein
MNIKGYEITPGVNLQGVNLRGADLQGVNLQGVNLQGVNLHGVKLYGANLLGANLQGADLQGVKLYGANLQGANLRGAMGLVPGNILQAHWGDLSEELTRVCMRYDMANGSTPKAFANWITENICPFKSSKVMRSINFKEQKELVDESFYAMPVLSAYEIMLRLFEYCHVKF